MTSIARPFGMLLMFLYEIVNNYGLAILLFAFVVKVILLPFQMKAKYGTMQQARLQPKIAELQKKHGTNRVKINEETQKLYREEGINPLSGCLWGVLPMPIMIALFMVIRQPLTMMLGVPAETLVMPNVAQGIDGGLIGQLLHTLGFEPSMGAYYLQVDQARFIGEHITEFARLGVDNLRAIDFNFLGLFDLGSQPQWNFLWTTTWSDSSVWLPGLLLFIIPLLSGGSQMVAAFVNKKLNPMGTANPQSGQMQNMMMIMPLISVYFAFITPAALGFYWTAGTILQIAQDIWLTKRYRKRIDAQEETRRIEREQKEAEIEAKRLETERKKAAGIFENNPNKSKKKKQTGEKQEQLEKAAEWQRKNDPESDEKVINEPSRVGNRRYARGRAYDPDRYSSERSGQDDSGDQEMDYESEDEDIIEENYDNGNDEGTQESDSAADSGYENSSILSESLDNQDEQPAEPEENSQTGETIRFDTTRFETNNDGEE